MAEENSLNELHGLMQQIAKSTKSMADSMQTQTSQQEKLLLDKSAKEDAKRTEQFHKEQQKKLQEIGGFGEEKKSIEEQSLEIQKQLLLQQEKNFKQQKSASEYLKTLSDLTKKNKEELQKLTDPDTKSRGLLGGAATGLARVEKAFKPATQSGLGIVGNLAGIGSSMISGAKKSKEKIGDVLSGSNKRQKRIEATRKDINDYNIAISAEKFELSEATKSGDKDRIKKARKSLLESKKELSKLSSSLSDDVTKEFMYQRKKQDPKFLEGFDSKTIDLIQNQQRSNIKASVMQSGGFGSNNLGKGGILPKGSTGMSGNASYLKSEAQEDRDENLVQSLMGAPISSSDSPSNYGEYIASMYGKLSIIAENLSEGSKSTSDGDVKSKGGGLLSWLKLVAIPAAWGLIKKGSSKAWDLTKKGASKVWDLTKKGSSKAWDLIKKGSSKAWDLTKKASSKTWDLIKKGSSKTWDLLKKGSSKAWDLLKKGTKSGIKPSSKQATKLGVKGGSTVTKVATKAASKTAAKTTGKAVTKSLVKKIPILGALASLGFAADRALSGDLGGAGLELLSGVAGSIPVVGTAASVGIDAALFARDMGAFDKKNKMKLDSTDVSNETLDITSTQRTFKPETNSESVSSGSSNKVTEYRMLAKMIAQENLTIQSTELAKAIARQKSTMNADLTKKALST